MAMANFEQNVPAEHKQRWNKTNYYAKWIAINFKTTRFGIPAILFLVVTLIGWVSPSISFIQAIIFALVLTGLYVGIYFRIIPAEDENGQPNVALPLILGERLPHILNPGPFLSMPGMGFILYQASVINLDLKIEGVRTRLNSIVPTNIDNGLAAMAHALRSDNVGIPESGGEVDVDVSLTIEVKTDDPWALIGLDQAGDLDGAKDIFRDAVAEDIRQVGRHLTWLELEFATDLVSAKLVRDLTDKKGLGDDNILDNPTEEKIREYLTQAQKNGFPDAKGLSLKVRRANITKVTAMGKLATAAEQAAVEKLKRAGLIENAKALGDAVKELRGGLKRGHGMSDREIIDRIQVDEDGSRVSKTITQIDIGDPEKVGGAIAAALAAFAGRNK